MTYDDDDRKKKKDAASEYTVQSSRRVHPTTYHLTTQSNYSLDTKLPIIHMIKILRIFVDHNVPRKCQRWFDLQRRHGLTMPSFVVLQCPAFQDPFHWFRVFFIHILAVFFLEYILFKVMFSNLGTLGPPRIVRFSHEEQISMLQGWLHGRPVDSYKRIK